MSTNAPPTPGSAGVHVVGRAAEVAAIRTVLDTARTERSSVLVVLGEPGIGKTTLLRGAIEDAGAMRVVSTRGIEAESELSLAGLVDVLRPVVSSLDSLVPQQRAVLEGVLSLGPPTPADPLGTSAAALALLAAAAEDEPLLLVVDDFQWLDAPSQLALVFVARRLEAERVGIVLAARALPPHLAQAGLPELRVGPLDRADASVLLRSRAPGAAPEVSEAILETAGGNPLAVVELASFLDEDQLTGRVPLHGPLPVNGPVEAAFTDLVTELGDEARRLLLVVAADDTSDPRVVRDAASRLGVGAATIHEAEASGVLDLAAPVRFRHPVLRSVVYHLATESDRRAAHAALGSVVDPDDSYRRAWHLGRATLDPDEEVASALADAASEARVRQRFSSAATAGVEAARLTPDPTVRSQRLVLAATDHQLSGNFPAADRCLTDALELTSDVALRAEVQRVRGHGLIAQGRWADVVALLGREGEQLADVLPDAAGFMLAQATMACQPLGRIDDGLALGRRAVEVAEKGGPGAQLAANLAYAEMLILRGDSRGAAELQARARSVAPLDDPMVAGMVLQSEAGYLTVLGEHDEARSRVEQLVVAAKSAGAAGVLPYPLGLLGEIDFRAGRWQQALAAASEAVELAEQTGQIAWGAFALQVLVRLEAALGRFEESERYAVRAQVVGDALGIEATRFYLPAARAFLALTSGDLESAVDHGREVEEISRERGLREPAVVLWAPDLVEAYVRLGRANEATRVLDRFSKEAHATGRSWALATSARCRGLLGDEFEPAFAEALERHEAVAMPFERARTELCLGERRRRTGRRADARSPLRSALRTFERLEATPWAERARAELSASGERVRPRDPTLTDQLTPHELRATGETARKRDVSPLAELTPQELQVARLVGEGATNKAVAAQLFVSPKTVDFHLRHVYRKLGIRSRAELGRLFGGQEE